MQLAESLTLKKYLSEQLTKIRSSISARSRSTFKKYGDQPVSDNVAELRADILRFLDDHNRVSDELYTLKHDVAVTNACTYVNGTSLTELLARRKALTRIVRRYEILLEPAGKKLLPTHLNEKRKVVSFNQKDMRKRYERLCRDLRHVNAQIQKTAWRTETLAAPPLDLDF